MALGTVCVVALALVSGVLDPLIARLTAAAPAPQIDPAGSDPASEGSPSVAASGATWSPAAAAAPKATIEAPDPFDQNNRAIDALNSGDLDRAIALFEAVVAARPDIDEFASNLGEAYLRRARDVNAGDPEAALEDFERAMEWTRDEERRERIAGLRDRARVITETEKEFVVEPTLHFTFKFDGTRSELLEGIEDLKILLENTYLEYGDLFRRRPVEAGEPRIEVVLYRAEGFDAVTGLGDWAGGVFDGTIRVPVENLSDRRRVARIRDVLRHETAHAFSHSIGGSHVPAWLNEGVAQWLENPARRDESVRYARARLASQAGDLFPLAELTGSLIGWKERAEITRAYDQALAFTDYVVRQYGIDIVFEMVAACEEGGAEGAAEHFRSRLLIDLDAVLGDFAVSLND